MLNVINRFKTLLCMCLLIIITATTTLGHTKKVKIAFWINLLSVRGVEVSVYDFADCNETILGNESIILNNTEYFNNPSYSGFLADYSESARAKFVKRFGNRFFDCATMQEAEEIMKQENVDIFYTQKYGVIDDKISHVCKNAMHAVFAVEKHGDAYACISSWLSSKYKSLNIPIVPLMVRVDKTKDTLRSELGIPENAIVFGRHGGKNTFSISFAKEAVQEMAQQHPEWYFLFLNTTQFCNLKNVIFLPLTADMVYKTKFINTCDIMLHAREDGETFGLACGEFSIKNKPVITCPTGDLCHVEILGNKGLYYRNKQELLDMLLACTNNIHSIRSGNWDCYSKEYNPEAAMKKFDEIFIQPLIH